MNKNADQRLEQLFAAARHGGRGQLLPPPPLREHVHLAGRLPHGVLHHSRLPQSLSLLPALREDAVQELSRDGAATLRR